LPNNNQAKFEQFESFSIFVCIFNPRALNQSQYRQADPVINFSILFFCILLITNHLPYNLPNPTMQLSIIVAMSKNRCIGQDNKLPWKLPDEWAYFKSVTAGKPFLMGRKSFESPDGLFSDTSNVVVSRRSDLSLIPPDIQAHSSEEALCMLSSEKEVFVLGGACLFEELLPKADKLYLSLVHAHIEGDVFFPEVNLSNWDLVYSDHHSADERHAYAFSMRQYIRRA
jgi:dihydrofolate reductase